MLLYHGSNVEVREPILIESKRALDFGEGFYLTSDYNQASKWADNVTLRRGCGSPTVSVFVFDFAKTKDLKYLSFDKPDREWLHFVAANRRKLYNGTLYDIVQGPVANDNTMPIINMYFSGFYDEDETVKRLLPQKLKDQFAFKTERAIKELIFKEVILCTK